MSPRFISASPNSGHTNGDRRSSLGNASRWRSCSEGVLHGQDCGGTGCRRRDRYHRAGGGELGVRAFRICELLRFPIDDVTQAVSDVSSEPRIARAPTTILRRNRATSPACTYGSTHRATAAPVPRALHLSRQWTLRVIADTSCGCGRFDTSLRILPTTALRLRNIHCGARSVGT